MKISELIKFLTDVKNEYGDMECYSRECSEPLEEKNIEVVSPDFQEDTPGVYL